jgi:sugar phosphate isomerase/epimerase
MLPLSYCTNVHPGTTLDAVLTGLNTHTRTARNLVGRRIAAGLWLAAPVIDELIRQPQGIARLRDELIASDLVCYTLNAFPYGNFHDVRVKEQVYLPDWSEPRRRLYTLHCAQVLSQLLPVGTEGSISTVPLAFKPAARPDDFEERCIVQLLALAEDLDHLHDESGQVIRLAIEPEPCCLLETTPETLAFFARLFAQAEERGLEDIARRHLGVCYDVCHQSVEFEDVGESIRQIAEAGIRINKVHLTCAIHLDQPGATPSALKQLAEFVEPRYLHQTFARAATGDIVHCVDLNRELCEEPTTEFRQASAWRVHFHVPVHAEQLGELQTTRFELRQALQAVSELLYAPHLEVETYTWGVLPGNRPASLGEGIAEELKATQALIAEIAPAI